MNPSVLSKTYSAASVQERGPGRFSDFALCGRKREPYASIDGHEHQDSPALLAGGVDYHGAVGRDSRRLVQSAISEDFYTTALQILGCPDAEAASAIGEDGTHWLFVYAVWPALVVFVTVTHPSRDVAAPSWAIDAVRSIRLS